MADKNIQLMSENGVDNLFPVTKWAIDTSNVLASGTSFSSYTATEDCWISLRYSTNVSSINVDGVNIWYGMTQTWGSFVYPLKKGQTFSVGNSAQVSNYAVYGVK